MKRADSGAGLQQSCLYSSWLLSLYVVDVERSCVCEVFEGRTGQREVG